MSSEPVLKDQDELMRTAWRPYVVTSFGQSTAMIAWDWGLMAMRCSSVCRARAAASGKVSQQLL